MSNESIGIFDSGVGGLTVLKELHRILPHENIIYLGDTARVPYGIRSPETVIQYSFECTEFLLNQKIKFLVVACNTVSAISLKEIQKKVSIPVIGVIEPGARAAVNSTKNGKIGIIGTEATIKSNAYPNAIKAISEDLEVFGLACPLFVPLVEEGWTDGIIARLIAEKYLKTMLESAVDTLILGCTHYPLLKKTIQDVMKGVFLVDSAIETAKVVREVLENQESRVDSQEGGVRGQGKIKFYVTDSIERFISVGERFLQQKIKDIERISL